MDEKKTSVTTQPTTETNTNTAQNPSLVRSFTPKRGSFFSKNVLIILCVAAVLGLGTGYMLKKGSGSAGSSIGGGLLGSSAPKGTVEGSNDLTTFKDTAEGTLAQGGIGHEGQYHLVRPGGDSQNVYLTSSLVDLSKYIGKKVKVWGQTQKAQTAGWFMDVGRVQVE